MKRVLLKIKNSAVKKKSSAKNKKDSEKICGKG